MRLRASLLAAVLLATSAPFALATGPVITGLDPASGPSGTWVTMNGTGLAGVDNVTLGGMRAWSYQDWNGTSLRFQVPNLAPGSYVVAANSANGTATWCCFEVTPAVPTIWYVSPRYGAPGTGVHVSGNRIEDAVDVRFGGVGVNFTASWWGVDFAVPNGTPPGFYAIDVETPSGIASDCCFRVVEPGVPYLDTIQPTWVAPGDVVHAYGAELQNVTEAWVGGYPAEILQGDRTSVAFRVPYDAEFGFNDVRLRTSDDRYVFWCCLDVQDLPRADLAAAVEVEKAEVRTDLGDAVNPAGAVTVTATFANVGDAPSNFRYFEVYATWDAEGVAGFDSLGWGEVGRLRPGASEAYTFEWDPKGHVGDVTFHARLLWGWDNDGRNDAASADSFVLVGGLGGADAPLM